MGALSAQRSDQVVLPLSLSQREVWRDQRAWPGSTHLYIGGAALVQGALDLQLLKAALDYLVDESDALRLVPQKDGTQQLLAEKQVAWEVIKLGPNTDLHQAIDACWERILKDPFVWSDRPPWRIAWLQSWPDCNAVVFQYHHLIMDGWGTAQMVQRWSEIYNAMACGAEPSAPKSATYVRFIEESNAYANSEQFAEDERYWNGQIPVLPPQLIERQYARGTRDRLPETVLGKILITVAKYGQLKQVATENNSTAFNYFLAALAVYFSRINDRQTVVVGVPSLNRGGRRYRETLGMFVGVLPVSVTVLPGMAVTELLNAIGLTMRGALRHARYPLSELGRLLEVLRNGRDGLFDILLSFERQDYAVKFGDAPMKESRQLFSGVARYPLSVTVCEFQADQDLSMVLEGSRDCFEGDEPAQLGARLWHLVESFVMNPEARIDDIPLLPERQCQAMLKIQHQHVLLHAQPVPFIVQFEQKVASFPRNVALVWDGGTLDYAELDRRANSLAQRLVALGFGKDQVVAVAMDRSVDLVVAILAVAKSGAAFLPLDPEAPLARLASVLEESAAVALLIQEHSLERLAQLPPRLIVASWNEALPDMIEAVPASLAPRGDDLAYVLFTSGSTGRPKGVMVEHASLSRRLAWLSRAYGVTPHDRSALSTQITFDPALIELCLPLIHGASVALPPPGRLLPEALAEFSIRQRVTIIAFVPSTLSRFLDKAADSPDLKLRVACCGGEVLPVELVNRYLRSTQARLFNVYGPTEACIFATAWECRPISMGAALPVGCPVDDTRIYVLDAQLHALPLGAVGEVFIGGGALARGYLNRPDLDKEAFVSDPFQSPGRMYRTGDRGWLDANGDLHFVGRLDRQIKLRGYRIELGEIEAALLAIEGVAQAAVKLVQRNGVSVLYAWVATPSGHEPESLQRVLRARLPDYMIPGGISVLPSLPVGNSGKLDYDALQVEAQVFHPMVREPNSALERALIALWQEELHVRPLSVHDNFFEAGGDSLAAISILAGVEKIANAHVPFFFLMEHPTVEQLALALESGSFDAAHESIVAFNPASKRTPFYIAASGHGDLLRFQNLAKALESALDVRMLQPPVATPLHGVVNLAEVYADAIEAQDVLPGYIAGFSIGGVTALETAHLLHQRGLAVQGLVLIDTIYPRAIWGGTLFWRLFTWLVRRLRLQELSMNGRRLGAMVSDAGLGMQVMAMAGYRPHRFTGPSLLIKTVGLARWDRLLFKPWRRLLGHALSERIVGGLHGSIFEPSQVAELAAVLRDATHVPEA